MQLGPILLIADYTNYMDLWVTARNKIMVVTREGRSGVVRGVPQTFIWKKSCSTYLWYHDIPEVGWEIARLGQTTNIRNQHEIVRYRSSLNASIDNNNIPLPSLARPVHACAYAEHNHARGHVHSIVVSRARASHTLQSPRELERGSGNFALCCWNAIMSCFTWRHFKFILRGARLPIILWFWWNLNRRLISILGTGIPKEKCSYAQILIHCVSHIVSYPGIPSYFCSAGRTASVAQRWYKTSVL